MATVSFKEATEPKPETSATETAPAVVEDKTLVTNDHYTASGMGGERDKSDIIRPRLTVVARTSKLLGDFKLGELVFNKQVGLGRGPIEVIVVDTLKYYNEHVDFDDPEAEARRFSSAAEVRAAGLRVHDKATAGKQLVGEVVLPAAEILFWIKLPDHVKEPEHRDLFGVTLPSGAEGALALYSAQRTSYTSTYKQVNTMFETSKRLQAVGVWGQKWKMTTTSEEYNGHVWEQARLAPNGATPDEDAAFLGQFAAQ